MTRYVPYKKMLITGLTAAMLVGGAGSAFANGNGNDRGNNGNAKNAFNYSQKDNGKDDRDNKKSGSSQVLSAANGKQNVQVGNHNTQIIMNFGDVTGGDVEWAIKNIASLAAKRVFEGYDDGTFRPRQTITHIEAITAAVRLMGLRDQAESAEEMATELNFSDANKVKQKYPWAIGYVAVAAENDLFLETDSAVEPEKPADRLWATTLLVKALKLEDEAKAKMNTKLSFKDANKIPAGSVGYIAVAVEKGLVNGYEDNTFRPDRPVTRAELAALLDRTSDQMPQDGALAGTLAAIPNGNSLSVVQDGQTYTAALDPNAFIFRGGVKVAVSALQVGDEVRVRLYNNVIIFVDVTKQAGTTTTPQTFTAAGTLNAITHNSQGQIATVAINQAVYGGTQVSLYNVSPSLTIIGNAALLVPNQAVELKGSNSIVTSIEIK
ncbi:MAG: S-layer homology domain-containing protein [Paenibacillaceae bacterium]|nr:S-layer homology domain-containing protein [Paenibacillaceae bacterium]